MSISKIPRYLLVGTLVTGVILILGFLAFVGMLALWSGMIAPAIVAFLATAAFFAAGLVEGAVYWQNITQSLDKLFKRNALEESISEQKLDQFLKERAILEKYKKLDEEQKQAGLTSEKQSKIKAILRELAPNVEEIKDTLKAQLLAKSSFLKDCAALQHYIHKLEDHPKLSDDDTKALETAKRQLKWQKQYFHHVVNSNQQDEGLNALLESDGNQKEEIQKRIKNNRWLLRIAFGISVLSLVGCFFVFLHIAPMSIIAAAGYFGIELSLAALPFGVTAACGVIAGAGYALLVYNALTNLILKETFTKWLEQVKQFFSGKEKFQNMGRAVGVVLVAAIAVLATLCTIGTWWGDGLFSAGLLVPYLGPAAAPLVLATIVVMGIATLCFNLLNGVRAFKKLSKINFKEAFKSFFADQNKKIESYKKSENKLQLINPFRLIMTVIEIPFKIAWFVYHIIATGIAGDRWEQVPVVVSATAGAFNDAFVDGGFVFSELSEHHRIYKKPHDHTHLDIFGWVLKGIFLLTGILLLSILWDWASSKFNNGAQKNPLTFRECFIKTWYGIEALISPGENGVKTPKLKFENWRQLFEYKIQQKKAKIEGKIFIDNGEKSQLVAECNVLYGNVLRKHVSEQGLVYRTLNETKESFEKHKSTHTTGLTPFVDKLIRCLPEEKAASASIVPTPDLTPKEHQEATKVLTSMLTFGSQ